jgi:hypothetical protein
LLKRCCHFSGAFAVPNDEKLQLRYSLVFTTGQTVAGIAGLKSIELLDRKAVPTKIWLLANRLVRMFSGTQHEPLRPMLRTIAG